MYFKINTKMALSEQEIIRRDKRNALISLNINPYPADLFPVNHTSKQVREQFIEGKKVILAGRLMSFHDQGKAGFAELQDSEGRIQLYFNRDILCPDDDKTLYNQIFKKLTDLGDFIGITGELFTTKVGAQCVQVNEFKILSKTLRPLPVPKTDENGNIYDGFTDPELRYRMRYVDLVVNPQVKEVFLKRTKLFSADRKSVV